MDYKKALETDVSGKTEKKNGLTYLSWSWAWAEFIKLYPSATYEIKKNVNGLPCFGDDKLGYMVYTAVTVDAVTHEMWLPVMDFKNKSMLQPTTFDINKAVMRCLTKNLAMFGLGLYIYSGEDLPETEELAINQTQIDSIVELMEKTKSDLKGFLEYFKIKEISQMTATQAVNGIKMLEKKIKTEAK